MINLYIKHKVSTITHYKDMNSDKNAKNGLVWGLWYPKVIGNITI